MPDDNTTSLDAPRPRGEELNALRKRDASGLTQRQREVLELMLAGHGNNEIARRLGVNRQRAHQLRSQLIDGGYVTEDNLPSTPPPPVPCAHTEVRCVACGEPLDRGGRPVRRVPRTETPT